MSPLQQFLPNRPGIIRCQLPNAPADTSKQVVTLLDTSAIRVVRFHFPAGEGLAEHRTTQFAIVQIVAGEGEFAFGSAIHEVSSGDVVWLPPGTPHAVKAHGPLTLLLIVIRPTATELSSDVSPIHFRPKP